MTESDRAAVTDDPLFAAVLKCIRVGMTVEEIKMVCRLGSATAS